LARETGAREIMVFTLRAKRGQQLAKALDLMDDTVIRAAIAADRPARTHARICALG
jgi:hypothetical protein